jgi:hypothetical protein
MNKIILYKNDLNTLEQYAKDRELTLEVFEPPFKDIELVIYRGVKGNVLVKDGKAQTINIRAYNKGAYINLYITIDDIAFGRLRVSNKGELLQNKLTEKIKDEDITMFYAVYFYLMDYIINHEKEEVLETKESKTVISNQKTNKHKVSKKKVSNTTYLFHSFSSYKSRGGHHKSPSYSFTVRGHYRKLKDGRKVWVKEHTKCANKARKETVYRI